MFTDIVGYSAMVQQDERAAYRRLEAHRQLVRRLLPRYDGHEVRTIGDAFLLDFASALLAVRFAVSLQQQLATPEARARIGVSLRIGLHLGDIERPGGDVYGDTVNIAARLQEQSPPGGIAMSAQVFLQTGDALALPCTALGPKTLKNIARPVEIHTLDAATLLAAPSSDSDALSLISAPTRTRRGLWLAGAAVVLLAVGAGVLIGSQRTGGHADIAPARVRPSVAVLPLSYAGRDDGAYLAEGIHDAVLNRLQQVHDLKVIAASSVRGYSRPVPDLRAVSRELGVANVVQGKVEASGGLVKVRLTLSDAGGAQRWAATFERKPDDEIRLGGQIAEQIAREVDSAVTPEEQGALEEIPTSSAKAYDLYQRATSIGDRHAGDAEALHLSGSLFEQSIATDPQFLWPYAGLVLNLINSYNFGITPDAATLENARERLKQMERLNADSSYTRLARSYFYTYVLHDAQRGAEEARAALRGLPGDPQLHGMLGIALSQGDQMPAAIEAFSKALELDPKNVAFAYDLADSYSLNHQYREALARTEPLVRAVPQELGFADARAYQAFGTSGDFPAFRATLVELSAKPELETFLRLAEYLNLALTDGRFDAALAYLHEQPEAIVYEQAFMPIPRVLVEANLSWLAGDAALAKRQFRQGLGELSAALKSGNDDIHARVWLALAHAVLGETAAAQSEMRVVRESIGYRAPAHRQTFATLLGEAGLALGDQDEALNQIELMLARPSYASAAFVARDATWKALRTNPRFQALVKPGAAPSAASLAPGGLVAAR